MDLGRLVCKRCARVLARVGDGVLAIGPPELPRCPCARTPVAKRDDALP
ncbi:MAG TPA: hypothetical protein VGR28_15550 [Candidatus Thermoplasmatota archaeon]|jgi:hypothetical protein|nr:hypothetical protein [Candidatus Thermoplasmatota archaeon]